MEKEAFFDLSPYRITTLLPNLNCMHPVTLDCIVILKIKVLMELTGGLYFTQLQTLKTLRI